MKDVTLFTEYSALQVELNRLEARKIELREKILLEMVTGNEKKIDTNFGSFSVATKKVWSYSPSVVKLEEKLKIARIKDQKKGTATAEENKYLVYNEKTV